MNTQQFLLTAVAAIALTSAAGAVVAQTTAPSRADVRASVLQARTHGELVPAGQGVEPFSARADRHPARSRDAVREEVLQARASGELVPAGQGMQFEASTAPSVLARAEVKESVRIARLQGELIPAGQGIAPDARATPRGTRTAATYAAAQRMH